MLLKAETMDRGKRLDALLHERLPEYSRSRLQSWIHDGRVLVNGVAGKPSSGHSRLGSRSRSIPRICVP